MFVLYLIFGLDFTTVVSFQMQEKLQQLQSQLIGHEAVKRDLEKTLAEKSDCESEEKQKLMQVLVLVNSQRRHTVEQRATSSN